MGGVTQKGAAAVVEPRLFRQVLGRFATGVTVVTTGTLEDFHGMTANAFASVSLDPPLVLVVVGRKARTCQRIPQFRAFGVNILKADQAFLSDWFAGRFGSQDELSPDLQLYTAATGTPLLEGTAAQLDCHLYQSHPAGDHIIFVGEVRHLRMEEEVVEPLLFFASRYHRLGEPLTVTPPRS